MRAGGTFAAGHRIAVGQQHGKRCLVPAHPHPVAAKHVGPVGKERDPAKPFGLALRAQQAIRCVEPRKLRIRHGVDHGVDRDLMGVAGQRDDQVVAVHVPMVVRLAIDR